MIYNNRDYRALYVCEKSRLYDEEESDTFNDDEEDDGYYSTEIEEDEY